jgi:hypothetical protein
MQPHARDSSFAVSAVCVYDRDVGMVSVCSGDDAGYEICPRSIEREVKQFMECIHIRSHQYSLHCTYDRETIIAKQAKLSEYKPAEILLLPLNFEF